MDDTFDKLVVGQVATASPFLQDVMPLHEGNLPIKEAAVAAEVPDEAKVLSPEAWDHVIGEVLDKEWADSARFIRAKALDGGPVLDKVASVAQGLESPEDRGMLLRSAILGLTGIPERASDVAILHKMLG